MEKTKQEWCELYGIVIRDPDGWRLKDSPPENTPITGYEFEWRMGMSTIEVVDRDRWLAYWNSQVDRPRLNG